MRVLYFSVVVSSEMAPGFHILVYGVTADDYVVTDSAYFPVQVILASDWLFSHSTDL